MKQAARSIVADHEHRYHDFPGNLLARVVKSAGKISVDEICESGDLRFRIPLRDMGLRRSDFSRTSLPGTAFFVNLAGETLVRKNIAVFVDLLEHLDTKDYDRIVNRHAHRHFGLVVDKDDVAHFQFHSSLVQQILTEDLDSVLVGWLR